MKLECLLTIWAQESNVLEFSYSPYHEKFQVFFSTTGKAGEKISKHPMTRTEIMKVTYPYDISARYKKLFSLGNYFSIMKVLNRVHKFLFMNHRDQIWLPT